MTSDPSPLQGQEASPLPVETLPQPGEPGAHMPPHRLVWLLRTIGWCTLLGFGLAVLLARSWSAGQVSNDFFQDYIAAVRVFQGIPPYVPLRAWPAFSTCMVPLNFDSHPPFSVLLVLPFGLLPLRPSLETWSFVCLAAYLASGILLLRTLGWCRLWGVALFVSLSALWNPLGVAIGTENFAQVLTFLLVLAWHLERTGKQRWAGIVLGGAALIKIWPIILFLPALKERRWNSILSGSVTMLGGTLMTLPILGLAAYTAYLGPVRLEETPAVPYEVNVSLPGAVARLWTGYSDPAVVTFPPLLSGLTTADAVLLGEGVAALLMLAACYLVVWVLRRAKGETVLALCLGFLVTVSFVCFPITWNWGVITFLLPLATLMVALRSLPRPSWWWFVLAGVGIVVIWYPLWLPLILVRLWPDFGALLFGLPSCGLLLFAGSQALLLYQTSKDQEKTRCLASSNTSASLSPSS